MAVAVIAVLVAMLVHAGVFARVRRGNIVESRFSWHTVGEYLFARPILDGLLLTIQLTVIAMLIGTLGGIVLAVMRLSANPVLRSVSWVYIWFFRGTPLLVQLLFWFNISYLFPQLSIGVPFGPEFVELDPNRLITPVTAAIIGLGLNEAAYMAEIVRGGILSVDLGQSDAATALGMSRKRTMRRIVLPQAMRMIVPVTGNQVIGMLKTTSMASIVTVTELLYATQLIYQTNYQTVPLLIVASIWYIVMSSILTSGQYYLERYFARGTRDGLPATPLQRLRGTLRRTRPVYSWDRKVSSNDR